MTVGTVYRYFRDKDALIEAALLHAARPTGSEDGLSDRPGATLPALADAVRRWGTFFHDAGMQSVRVVLSDPGRDHAAVHAMLGDAVQEYSALIAKGILRKDIRADIAPATLARALVGSLLFAPMLDSAGGTAGASTADDIEGIVALATRGVRPDGPSWRPATGG